MSTKNLRAEQPRKNLGWTFLGPFKVLHLFNDVMIELSLPKNLKHIYPVFHFSLLKRDPGPGKWHPELATLPLILVGRPTTA